MSLHKIAAFLLLALSLFASACGAYSNGKTWIPNLKYDVAQEIYDETGSLKLTEEKLRDDPTWSRAEINEAVYRLQKKYRLE